MRSTRGRSLVIGAVIALALVGITACELPTFTPTILVTSRTTASDAVPGDGVCEATIGAGDCTVPAAISEANAAGRATIEFGWDNYTMTGAVLPDITGHITMRRAPNPSCPSCPRWVRFSNAALRVAPGASLWIDDLDAEISGRPPTYKSFTISVDGVLVARNSHLLGLSGANALTIGPSGTVIAENSNLGKVENAGELHIRHANAGISTVGSGISNVASSILFNCAGTTPVSGGYNATAPGTCTLTGTGDRNGVDFQFDYSALFAPMFVPLATSPLTDAIPPGTNGCGTEVTIDHIGTPRPTDGNGDAIAGCDIGGAERP